MRKCIVALLLAGSAPAGFAQTVRGAVVGPDNRPIAGIVVALVDAGSREVGRALTDDRGEYRLAAPAAGTYRLRTLRIGFRPLVSEPIALAVGSDVTRQLAVSTVAFSLDTVRSVGRNACQVIAGDSASLVAGVWDQVRSALAAAQLSLSNRLIYARTVTYQRMIGLRSQRVGNQSMDVRSDFGTQPWRSLSADSLHRFGYVMTARDSSRIYYSPDLAVLLSDEFVEDHCFRIAKGSDDHRIGIEFEPTRGRKNVADVRGTLWLDRHTNELMEMEHRYVGDVRSDEERIAGGEMGFARMQNGLWTISRWSIHMPVRALVPIYSASFSLLRRELRVDSIRVTGGELVLATTTGTRRDTIWMRPPLSLRGLVVDSSTGAPMRRATVAIGGTGQTASTDDAGHFVIHGVIPGRYAVTITSPTADSLAILDEQNVFITDTVALLTLKVPATRLAARHAAPVPMLDSVVTGTANPDSLPDRSARNRRTGMGHFLTREEIEERRSGSTGGLLQAMPGLRIASQGGDYAFNPSEACSTRDDVDQGKPGWMGGKNGGCSKFYVPPREDQIRGVRALCYTRIYIDRTLMNPGTPTPPYDLREISPGEIEAVEYYGSAAEMPVEYRGLSSSCGLVILHTRRTKR